ncbi:MAG: hypothetical protein QM791_12225 [Ferruginibacter sp.]
MENGSLPMTTWSTPTLLPVFTKLAWMNLAFSKMFLLNYMVIKPDYGEWVRVPRTKAEVMPNHLHAIMHFENDGFNLNEIISNGKRFMAYEIINRLELAGNKIMLERLASLASAREKKKGQLHKVFKDSFDAKAVITHAFLLQKINYIHYNPVSGKWILAIDFTEYGHSSASFYELQIVKHFRPVHYIDFSGRRTFFLLWCIRRRGFAGTAFYLRCVIAKTPPGQEFT